MTPRQIDPKVLEAVSLAQSDNWHFCVKLMFLLRNGSVDTSDTNFDIYKAVMQALAEDAEQMRKEEQRRREEFIERLKNDY